MARTDLTVQAVVKTGVVASGGVVGIADGHKFPNTGRTFVRVTKTTTSGDITFQTPKTISGLAIAELVVSLAVETQLIGPFPTNLFNQADGKVYVDYQGTEEGEFTIEVFNL